MVKDKQKDVWKAANKNSEEENRLKEMERTRIMAQLQNRELTPNDYELLKNLDQRELNHTSEISNTPL